MKNMRRILGVIAMVAVIGLVAGCLTEADPEDQVIISFTEFPTKANAFFIRLVLTDELTTNEKILATGGDTAARIRNNTGTNAMLINDGGDAGKAFGKAGSYYVHMYIYETAAITGDVVYYGHTKSKLPIGKGQNTFPLSADARIGLYDEIEELFALVEAPDENFFGIYTGAGYGDGVIETINFTDVATFRISDSSGTGGQQNYLAFTIQKWDSAEVPAEYRTAYPIGYKFTGIITGGFQINNNTTGSFIYGSQTAPNFSQTDIDNKTPCHMYIVTTTSSSGVLRVYSKS